MLIRSKSQSLIEVLVAVGVGVVLISSAIFVLSVTLHSQANTKLLHLSHSLAVKIIDDLKTISQSDWHSIYDLSKGEENKYYVYASGTQLIIRSGQATTTVEGEEFTHWFYVENVNRDTSGDITETGGTEDPSTQKVTVKVSFQRGGTKTVTLSSYLTRWQNKISKQTHWEKGGGETGAVKQFTYSFSSSTGIDYSTLPGSIVLEGFTSYTTNIDPDHHYAWSDTAGWLDMRATDVEDGVFVSTDDLRGFGYGTSYGLVSFNCSNENECSTSDYKVSNSLSGQLSGWAWSEKCGWITFSSSTTGEGYTGSSYDFGVTIDTDGVFHDYAWSDNCGWIVFNCSDLAQDLSDPDYCDTVSDFYVKTEWTAQ